MVTILPIDVEDDLVREGLALAIAERVRSAVLELTKQANELSAAGLLDRHKWDAAFDHLATLRASMTPVLEYAKAFDDQWPADEEGESNEAEA